MGNCFSGDISGGRQAVGGAGSAAAGASSTFDGGGLKSTDAADAVDHFLKSRGLRGLVSQIEDIAGLLFCRCSKMKDVTGSFCEIQR